MNANRACNPTSRRFVLGRAPGDPGKARGRGRVIGSATRDFDQGSLWVVVAVTLFAFVLLTAITGFFALLWLMALGPLSLGLFAMLASMGGVEWQRAVGTVYVIVVGIVMVWAAGA